MTFPWIQNFSTEFIKSNDFQFKYTSESPDLNRCVIAYDMLERENGIGRNSNEMYRPVNVPFRVFRPQSINLGRIYIVTYSTIASRAKKQFSKHKLVHV